VIEDFGMVSFATLDINVSSSLPSLHKSLIESNEIVDLWREQRRATRLYSLVALRCTSLRFIFDQFGKQNQGLVAAKYGLLLEYFEYLLFNDSMLTVLETTLFAAFSVTTFEAKHGVFNISAAGLVLLMRS
jgi:hypothetical protein